MITLITSSKFLRSKLVFTRKCLVGKQAVNNHFEDKKSSVQAKHHPKKKKNFFGQLSQAFGTLLIILAISTAGIIWAPDLYYTIFPAEEIRLQAKEDGTPYGGKFDNGAINNQVNYDPPVDTNLPAGNWLVISKIGLRAELSTDANSKKALEKGLWMAPDYGQPGSIEKPVIIAGHRYGWDWWWKNEYWKYHSFYLLPQLEPGDRVEIISNQKKYTYEIYKGEEGDEITDYSADMILYTCKFINSPVRMFRYGRLIDPTKDTQAR